MQKLGMKEGFDVALEMSGSPKAFNDMLPNMFHGGKIALLGIMPDQAAIDWNTVVFSALTIKGIYGREMYETWYKMTAMIQSGLDISPVITHRFPYTQFKEGIELMKSGNSGKIVLDWSGIVNLRRVGRQGPPIDVSPAFPSRGNTDCNCEVLRRATPAQDEKRGATYAPTIAFCPSLLRDRRSSAKEILLDLAGGGFRELGRER